jgi:hypothetical protein
MLQISTIAQFRARDYGMEHCTLEVTLPKEFERQPGVIVDHSKTDMKPDERSWQLSGDLQDLEIWGIDATDWLDISKLTYSSRPKRLSRLGSLQVRPNDTVSTHSFPCPSDSIQSFEIFCISPGCTVDIWQNRQLPPMGECFPTCVELYSHNASRARIVSTFFAVISLQIFTLYLLPNLQIPQGYMYH